MGHVACMGEMRNLYSILVGKLKGRDHSEDIAVDGMIILKWIREIGWEVLYSMHLAQNRGQVVGYCEHSNEPSSSIK
jgi:hypothetical protein